MWRVASVSSLSPWTRDGLRMSLDIWYLFSASSETFPRHRVRFCKQHSMIRIIAWLSSVSVNKSLIRSYLNCRLFLVEHHTRWQTISTLALTGVLSFAFWLMFVVVEDPTREKHQRSTLMALTFTDAYLFQPRDGSFAMLLDWTWETTNRSIICLE